jgi:pilus assembly protein CpaB
MKPKTLILMVVAVGCGLAASYMTSRVIAERGNADVTEEKVKVLVAKQNLAMGTLIKDPEKFFEEKSFTKGEEPKRALRDFSQLKDRMLNKPLSAEQFVSQEDLMDKNQGGLSSSMQKGMRAVGLKVNVDTTAGGFVLPNSRVDIVSVVRRGDGDTLSKIILQNVLILAVDTTSTRPDDRSTIVASTVTVSVTPEQAEKLSLATEMGTLRFILRAFGDDEVVRTKGETPKGIGRTNESNIDAENAGATDDSGSRAPVWGPKVPDVPVNRTPVVEAKQPEPPPPPKKHTMTIFNGESVTKAVYLLENENGGTVTQIEKSQPEREPAFKGEARPAPVKR